MKKSQTKTKPERIVGKQLMHEVMSKASRTPKL